MKYDAVIDSLPIYSVSNSAKLGYQEKETWLKLDWNESSSNASVNVINAIKRFLDVHSLSYYPDVTSRELIEAIAERYSIPENFVSVFNGSDNALQHIFYTFLSENSTFTTFQPTYTQILQFIDFKKPNKCLFQPEDVFNIDYKLFEEKFIANADLVYLINPHNPIGNLLTKDYLFYLIRKYPDTLFVIDEAYMEFASSDESCIEFCLTEKNIIVTRTFSKAFGLAGIRLGYAISHSDNIGFIQKIKNNKDVNTLAQIAGTAAIRDLEYLNNHIKNISETKKWFIENVPDNYRTIDSEANFVLISYEKDNNLLDRLEKNRVLVRDRSDLHGLKNYLRITIGTRNQMQKVIEILKNEL